MKLSSQSLQIAQRIRNFRGTLPQFTKHYIAQARIMVEADMAVLSFKDVNGSWRILSFDPDSNSSKTYLSHLAKELESLNEMCNKNGYAVTKKEFYIIAVKFQYDPKFPDSMALFCFKNINDSEISPIINALHAISDLYAQHKLLESVTDVINQKKILFDIVDVAISANEAENYKKMLIGFCNDVCDRFDCHRVMLGWHDHKYIKLQAVSHLDHFEKKMELVEEMESVMEEAFDQEMDISIPSETEEFISYNHKNHLKKHGLSSITSLIIRHKDENVGVLLLEKDEGSFSTEQLLQLRLGTNMVSTRMFELHERSGWIGKRMVRKYKEFSKSMLHVEHSGIKLIALLILVITLLGFIIRTDYRVDSTFILKTDKYQFLTAPFDGYIDTVFVKQGEIVTDGDSLLVLDNKEMMIEHDNVASELKRYRHEKLKAMANEDLAEMNIAQAKITQSIAQLDKVDFKLQNSVVLSPFDKAVIVEGELENRDGAPVKIGSQLFKIARIEDIYVEIELPEEEIDYVEKDMKAEVMLKSRPDDIYEVSISLIQPVAVVKNQQNVFLLRCDVDETIPEWFRPGMTGVSKVITIRRSLWWIVTHRMIDELRMKFWW